MSPKFKVQGSTFANLSAAPARRERHPRFQEDVVT
jgi:hypothetical protein